MYTVDCGTGFCKVLKRYTDSITHASIAYNVAILAAVAAMITAVMCPCVSVAKLNAKHSMRKRNNRLYDDRKPVAVWNAPAVVLGRWHNVPGTERRGAAFLPLRHQITLSNHYLNFIQSYTHTYTASL